MQGNQMQYERRGDVSNNCEEQLRCQLGSQNEEGRAQGLKVINVNGSK